MCLSIVGTVILLKMCLVGCGDSHGTGLDPEEFKEVSAELTGGLGWKCWAVGGSFALLHTAQRLLVTPFVLEPGWMLPDGPGIF